MDHVHTDDRIGVLNRPHLAGNIEVQRWPDVRNLVVCCPAGDGRASVWVGIAGLPLETGQCLSEMDDMLARAAGDLQHKTAVRKDTSENL